MKKAFFLLGWILVIGVLLFAAASVFAYLRAPSEIGIIGGADAPTFLFLGTELMRYILPAALTVGIVCLIVSSRKQK